MAKRFSETDKWNDEWFCELKPLQKLVFLFIIDRCDNAGFMEINARINSFLIGITPQQYEGAIKELNRCLIMSNDGKKLWVVNFLKHQKNLPLNFENNAHKQIIFLLNENQKFFEFDFEKLGANQGLISPLGKGNGKDTGKGKEGGVGETEILWTTVKKNFLEDGPWQYNFCSKNNTSLEKLEELQREFLEIIEEREDFKTLKEIENHFINWFRKNKKNGNKYSGSIKAGKNNKSAGTYELLADFKKTVGM